MRLEPVPQKDDILYRDYLVEIEEIFAKPTSTEFEAPLSDEEIRLQTLQGLQKKFKQDFSTTENNVIGANHVPIEVLISILVKDLGISAGNIPDQGELTDRQYLDDLIALSNQTIESLSTTYRINLSRSDLEKTTRVRENILTLQSHLRDDEYESTRFNPFFLYKDEWRIRFRTSFFPENHYVLKKGLFTKMEDRNSVQALISAVKEHKDFNLDASDRIPRFVSRMVLLLILDHNLTEGHRQFASEEYGLSRDHYEKAVSNVRNIISQMQITVWALPSDGTTIEEASWTPSLEKAEDFLADLDPATSYKLEGTTKLLFGTRPNWGGPYWAPYTNGGGKKHIGIWKEGKNKKWWDPVDKRTWNPLEVNIPAKKIPDRFPYTAKLFERLKWRYRKRVNTKVNSMKTLQELETRNTVTVNLPLSTPSISYSSYPNFLASASYQELGTALQDIHDDLISLIPHVMFLMLPICQGDVSIALGDYPTAANHYAQIAVEQLLRASLEYIAPGGKSESTGDLPWSRTTRPTSAILNGKDYPYLNEDCETPLLLLRLGSLYLSWADQLYRIDQEPEVFRARELYKAVLRQYGIDPMPGAGLVPLPIKMSVRPTGIYDTFKMHTIPPDIKPVTNPGQKPNISAKDFFEISPAAKAAWSPLIFAKVSPEEFAQPDINFAAPFLSGAVVAAFISLPLNPAILAQQTRARIGITQIDAALNYYGYTYNLVPILRYHPLAAWSRHFSALAKQAETDFLSYKERAEKAELGLLEMRNALATAAIRVQIESQRILQAQDQIKQAEIQVQQVKDAIAVKKAEIEDYNSLWGQIKDFFSGIKDFFSSGIPDKAVSYIKSDFSVAFGFETAAAGATAGLGVVGGIALFGISTSVTMSGMADNANKRVSELQNLQTQQLPMALAALDSRKRELAISQMQKAVATFEALTAQEILRYSILRTLNIELWTRMASAMKSVLIRYLDLGAMTGWLAERALSYEQDRDLRLIRFDYFQRKRYGLLAADELQGDLASLEGEYITGLQQMMPIKWTISLALDFPLQFGQLKAKGYCTIMTNASPLDLAYPGSYGHRVRALEVTAVLPITEPPPRGLLSNPGISYIESTEVGDSHTLVRPPDVFPLSEFTLENDMVIYKLPGETLMPFEGSGINTLWELEFPAGANTKGLGALADICITFYLQSHFSPSRKVELVKAGPPTLTRSSLFSAKQLFPDSLKIFNTGENEGTLEFIINEKLLPDNEKDRQVTNVLVFFLGNDLPEISGTITSTEEPMGANFTTDKGLAHSNIVPLPAVIPIPPSTINSVATGTPIQNWTIKVVDTNNDPTLERKNIDDVILGIEYTTRPTFKEE